MTLKEKARLRAKARRAELPSGIDGLNAEKAKIERLEGEIAIRQAFEDEAKDRLQLAHGEIDRLAKAIGDLAAELLDLREKAGDFDRIVGNLEGVDLATLAGEMFAAYKKAAGGLTHDGKKIPTFKKVRDNWIAAAKFAVESFK